MTRLLLALGLATTLPLLAAPPAWALTLRVAVAASAHDALEAIASDYARATGVDVQLSPGSSGKLYHQIRQGAPFDLFYAADAEHPARLANEGRVGERRAYARGRLVLWVPTRTGLDPAAGLGILTASAVKHVAIAHPVNAPYGQAAVEALEAAQIRDRVEAKWVVGENIGQAAQFAETSADAALLSLSLATSPRLAARGSYAFIPETMHRPLLAEAVVLKASRQGEAASRFLAYSLAPAAEATWRRFGLEPAP